MDSTEWFNQPRKRYVILTLLQPTKECAGEINILDSIFFLPNAGRVSPGS